MRSTGDHATLPDVADLIAHAGVGGWLEFAALAGFALVNVLAVFVALIRALGLPDEDPTRAPVHVDRGAMSDGGVPYVRGPDTPVG
jgi:hypothetical protein